MQSDPREIEKILKAPFYEKDIEWRVQSSGIIKQPGEDKPWAMVLCYVTARAVMDRLDAAFGIDGWRDDYSWKNEGVVCNLSVKINGEWVTKIDGSPETEVEAFKGGISKALVRAAVKFGVGRYLYKLDASFAECSLQKKNGWRRAFDKKTKKVFYWTPPSLPKWALPEAKTVVDQYGKIMRTLKAKTKNWSDMEFLQEFYGRVGIEDKTGLQKMTIAEKEDALRILENME